MSGAPQGTAETWNRARIRFTRDIARDDWDRVLRADFVVVRNTVVKDRYGERGREATAAEQASCVVIS